MNKDLFVDMHIHSYYSDGTESVESICNRAVHNNVGIISITDHNELAGTKLAVSMAFQYGLLAVSGVEIDSIYNGRRCHILGYGFELNDEKFNDFVKVNKRILEKTDETTLKRIAEEYPIDVLDYGNYSYTNKGGWKLLHFLVDQGVANDMEEAIQLMKRYKERAKFPKSEEVIQEIHNAGGVAILAHPGVTFEIANEANTRIDRYLEEFCKFGIDGIECFYPRHKEVFERYLVEFCQNRGMCITAGCDYHGEFFRGSKQKIGCEFKSLRDVNLKKICDFS